jgi:phage gp36-like protein
MAYCTSDNLKQVETEQTIIDLTDDNDTGSIVSDNVNRAIADADALIDSYLTGRVASLPLSPVPSLISKISIEIAVYNLYLRRYGGRMPEGVADRYKEAKAMLKDIRDGKLQIALTIAEDTGGLGAIAVSKSNSEAFSNDVVGMY